MGDISCMGTIRISSLSSYGAPRVAAMWAARRRRSKTPAVGWWRHVYHCIVHPGVAAAAVPAAPAPAEVDTRAGASSGVVALCELVLGCEVPPVPVAPPVADDTAEGLPCAARGTPTSSHLFRGSRSRIGLLHRIRSISAMMAGVIFGTNWKENQRLSTY